MLTPLLAQFFPENRRVLFFVAAALVAIPAVVVFSVMLATAQNANQATVFTAMLLAAISAFLTHSCIVLAILARKWWIFVAADVALAFSMICAVSAAVLHA